MSSFYPAISRSPLASLYVQLRTIVGSSLFLSIIIALIALTHTALSQIPIPTPSPQTQDWSKLPELPLWYEEINGLGGMLSYLPDFDTENGGKNALACNGKVIYNRFKGDTSAMFQFPGGFKVFYGDYNGDGIRDYFTHDFYLFQGLKNGTPPNKKFTQYYYDGYSNYAFIANTDFNQDGKDDIVFSASSQPDTASSKNHNSIGTILVGGDDLTKLEVVKLPFTEKVTNEQWQIFEKQCLMDAYHLEGKGLRIITMTHLENTKTFKLTNPQLNLWAVEITGTRNNRKVLYTLLHSLKIPETSGYPDILPYRYQGYHNRMGIHALSLRPNTYSLHTDKILLAVDNPLFGGGGWSLYYSIRSNKPFTWMIPPQTLDSDSIITPIFDGDPRNSNIPFAKMYYSFRKNSTDELFYHLDGITTIGDVNNDGLNDIATMFDGPSRLFRIYLGLDGTTSNTSNVNSESINIDFPQPIHSSKPTMVRVSVAVQTQATLTLYTQRGEIATQLWIGELQQGENSIPFDAQRLGLSRGWYNLRLQLGSKVIDKALIIE